MSSLRVVARGLALVLVSAAVSGQVVGVEHDPLPLDGELPAKLEVELQSRREWAAFVQVQADGNERDLLSNTQTVHCYVRFGNEPHDEVHFDWRAVRKDGDQFLRARATDMETTAFRITDVVPAAPRSNTLFVAGWSEREQKAVVEEWTLSAVLGETQAPGQPPQLSLTVQPVAKVIPRRAALLTPRASLPDLDESTDSPAIQRLARDMIITAPHESTFTTGCQPVRKIPLFESSTLLPIEALTYHPPADALLLLEYGDAAKVRILDRTTRELAGVLVEGSQHPHLRASREMILVKYTGLGYVLEFASLRGWSRGDPRVLLVPDADGDGQWETAAATFYETRSGTEVDYPSELIVPYFSY